MTSGLMLVAFAVLGVTLGIIGVEFGLLAMGVSAAVALGFGIARRAEGGALILVGLGATWTILFTNAALTCSQNGQLCGATPINMTPHIVASLALTVLGVVLALWSGLRRGVAR